MRCRCTDYAQSPPRNSSLTLKACDRQRLQQLPGRGERPSRALERRPPFSRVLPSESRRSTAGRAEAHAGSRAGRARRRRGRAAPRAHDGAGLRSWSGVRRAHRTAVHTGTRLPEPPESRWRGCRRGRSAGDRSAGRRSPLRRGRRCAPPCAKSRTSVHGIGSRHGAMPNGAARSHSSPKFCAKRASSGSLPATSACARAKARRGFEHRQEIGGARLGLEAQDLDVEAPDARAGQARNRFAHDRRVADRRVAHFGRRRRNQPQPDMGVPGVGRARDHFRRRQLEYGQRGESNGTGHGVNRGTVR